MGHATATTIAGQPMMDVERRKTRQPPGHPSDRFGGTWIILCERERVFRILDPSSGDVKACLLFGIEDLECLTPRFSLKLELETDKSVLWVTCMSWVGDFGSSLL